MNFSMELLKGYNIKREEWGNSFIKIEEGKMMLTIKEGIQTELKVINTEDIMADDWEIVHEKS